MYAINAEATPTESAWEKGIALAKQTIDTYKQRHNDSIPRKVSYTLWSSEFIETGGATIAQVLYMLGVEPVRDAFGRVSDLKLIPSAELGRPRIDVVVQTSGQLRDLAASRLFLINRAVEMAAGAKDDKYENQVATSVIEAERVLTEKGLSPKDAREISTFRIFGGINGMYGTGIQEMVESGDRWENESELATTYLNNMGAYYGSEKNWEVFQKFAFEAALTRTDVVVQPRQSNTWGALSLDHVYEFMGGMNLAVRNVTGKDPDAYLSDYRNRNNMKMQELKEAVGVESRTTILNPVYIKEKMKGGASSASEFAEVITNTYGWNVMKTAAIDKELWDNIYNVYVKDELNLGVKKYFEQQNPAALEEMTAVMLESARKGLWKASEEQVAELSKLHTEIVNNYRPSCSGFVCDNAKLRDYIASKADAPTAAQYKENISKIREAKASGNDKGVVMKKEEMNQTTEAKMNTVVLVLMLLTAFNFLLKQTFWKVIAVCVIAAICAAFAGLMWPYAIEQSKTQIANWLSNQPLMLDTAVLLSVEVCVQMAYAMLAVHVANDYPVKPRMIVMYRFLRWFPGLLIFPVLFSGLIYLIFAFPGISFQTIAWSYAGFILIAIPSGRYLLLYLLPEKELRLELFFLTNALVAILGIVATVNGRTSATGVSEIDWQALAGVLVITLAGGIIGLVWWNFRNRNKQKSMKQ